jgi:uncharacterized membrane protein YidH (DUF202 family)
MAGKEGLLSEKRTHLAQKRTELAYERTIMAYLRTATTVILFGIAFLGISTTTDGFLFYAGIGAITVGILIVLFAINKAITHSQEINKITGFFGKIINFKFKKKL